MDTSEIWRNLFLYGGIGFAILISLVVINKVAKSIVGRKVRSMPAMSMTLEDLERMRATGLIQEEEYTRARLKISQKWIDESLPRSGQSAEQALGRELETLKTTTIAKSSAPAETTASASESAPIPAASPDPPGVPEIPDRSKLDAELQKLDRMGVKKTKKDMPLDLDGLLATGAIDEAEYKRLRAYFESKPK